MYDCLEATVDQHDVVRLSTLSIKQRQIQRWTIAALALLAYAWRVQGLARESLWRDEIDAVYFALRDLPETLSMFVNAAQNGALFFLSLRPWLRLTGTSEFALRYPAVLFATLSVVLLWQVGRRLMPGRPSTTSGGRKALVFQLTLGSAPLLAAAFLAVNPYQTWHGQDGKMYALVTFLALLAAWFWLAGIGHGGWRPWLGYLIVVSIGLYTHLLLVLLIPLGVIWFFIAWPLSREHKVGYLLSVAGLTLPYLPMIAWQWSLLTASRQLTALTFYPLDEVLESVLLSQSLGTQEPGTLLEIAPILLLGAAGLLLGFLEIHPRPDDLLSRLAAWRRHLLIVTWLLFPVLGIFLLSLRQPVFLPRYVIWIAPAAMMLLALGVQLLWHNEGRLAKPLAAVLAAYVLIFWFLAGQQQKAQVIKPDLRAAVKTIAENREPDELLILQVPYMEPAYRYYSSDQGPDPFAGSDERLGRWTAGLWTNNELNDDEARQQVAREMAFMTSGADDIWVLLSEAETWDERSLMIEWLEEQTSLVDKATYHQAEVRHYQLP